MAGVETAASAARAACGPFLFLDPRIARRGSRAGHVLLQHRAAGSGSRDSAPVFRAGPHPPWSINAPSRGDGFDSLGKESRVIALATFWRMCDE